MSTIKFDTTLYTIGSHTILRLPEQASAKLPSRGQTMVEGSLNGVAFTTPLEPDGRLSHWFTPNQSLLEVAKVTSGDAVTIELTPIKVWPEPEIPSDLSQALAAHPEIQDLWRKITPMARWEWMRWIRSTGSAETREHRIEVACSKMAAGERRPCCWNRNLCTQPDVSKSGQLLEPAVV